MESKEQEMINFIKRHNPIVITIAAWLLVGCGGGSGDTTQQTTEWAVKLVAEDLENGLQFSNDRLGQVDVATNNVDNYDLKSMPRPFPKNSEGALNPFLSVSFPQNGKGYVTNFHSTDLNKADEWIFTVNSNADRTVTLRWETFTVTSYRDDTGRVRFDQELSIDENLVKRMQLVDAETNTTLVSAYANGELQSYTFNMNGETTRTFKWKLNSENVVEKVQEASAKYEPLYKATSMRFDTLEMDKQIDITMPPQVMGK